MLSPARGDPKLQDGATLRVPFTGRPQKQASPLAFGFPELKPFWWKTPKIPRNSRYEMLNFHYKSEQTAKNWLT